MNLILKVALEGLGLGALLILVCAVGIRKGAVGMVHLYSRDVQERCVELGLTTHETIRKNSLRFKCICMPGYIAYVLICVYAVNGARGFLPGFWQLLVILSVMNVIDRFLIDDWWVGHTKAWTIPGTEDLKPYITAADKRKKRFGDDFFHGVFAPMRILPEFLSFAFRTRERNLARGTCGYLQNSRGRGRPQHKSRHADAFR